MEQTLASLSLQTGVSVLDHLERSMRIPVVDGLQAQGDLIVVPLHLVARAVKPDSDGPGPRGPGSWRDVPPEGVELLRAEAGGNTHSLVAEPGTCRWTTNVADETGLAIGVFTASEVVYLLHPEHGASGCAPGTYVVRRQREHDRRRGGTRFVAD
ncbi:hypothetical protein [Actinomadura verrucosospora]|uniref:Uncharacterized protein n=1 Tax=Actinomadura verrucosospora TaxID=46165 RepID=A0A7D3ZPN2_ACTVE|nr:hypothetical protein [Actinomadura verrucosospora]QKG24223.1 hypothetical protein ACTIVE_5866 [Actinomadura verrucosospora]